MTPWRWALLAALFAGAVAMTTLTGCTDLRAECVAGHGEWHANGHCILSDAGDDR